MVEWGNRTTISSEVAKFQSYEHRDGKKEAEADIARGTPKWKVHGLQRDTDIRGALMKKSLELELDWFAGCVVSSAIQKYAYEYDTVIWEHMVVLYGEPKVYGILEEKPRKPDANEQNG
jgi:hypothetical protein